MTYKNKLIILLSLIAFMALLYAASFIFNYDRNSAISSSYAWLDFNSAEKISRISIDNGYEKYELVKKNSLWFIIFYGNEFPARALRVQDFISIFTTRSSWHVRSASASSHERFGLGEDAARITFYGEYSVILDLLLGDYDNMGSDAYFRRVGQNEVRSGGSGIYAYVLGSVTSWYNLRLIPQSADGGVTAESVQRLTVYNEGKTYTYTRKGRTWDITGADVENPDVSGIENYINIILNSEGEDFLDSAAASGLTFDYSSIVVELGNGGSMTIRMSAPDENDRRYAQVNGGNLTYAVPLWAAERVFRDASGFEML